MRHITAIVIFVLIASRSLFAGDFSAIPRVSSSTAEYHYQIALYHFFKGDYLTASRICRDILDNTVVYKNKINLLLRFSDLMLQNTSYDYPEFIKERSTGLEPGMITLLDRLYRNERYQEVVHLSSIFDDHGGIRYFEGMSLVHLNRLEDAVQSLLKVSDDDEFYPYARIALAQIEVMRLEFKKAEKYLRELLGHGSLQDTTLRDRVYLLMGQILFERGLFSESLNEFLKVSFDSEHFQEALLGQAWSLVRLEDYENALTVLKGIGITYPYNTIEQDALILRGYCLTKLNRFKEAEEHFTTLLKTYEKTKRDFERIIDDPSVRKRYVSALLEKDIEAYVTGDEYLSVLSEDPELLNILRQYKLLSILKDGFERAKEEASEVRLYAENMVYGLAKLSKRIEEEISLSKRLLVTLKRQAERKKRETMDVASNTDNQVFLASIEQGIYDSWRNVLKREITEDEKMIVRLILLEGVEALECLNSPVVCPIVHFMNQDNARTKPEHFQGVAGVLEMIGKDLRSVRKGDKIQFERVFTDMSMQVKKRIDGSRRIIEELDKIDSQLNNSIETIDKGLSGIPLLLDDRIKERFIKLKYDLENFKNDIMTGLNAVRLKSEGDIEQ